MKTCGALFLALVMALTPGCSFLRGSSQSVRVVTAEPSTIFVDNHKHGTAPGIVMLDRRKGYTVRCMTKDGRGGIATLEQRRSAVGWVDIVLGSLGFLCIVTLPWWLGVIAPGHYDLDPETVIVQLPPQADKISSDRRTGE